jgi:hypothetical protein
MADYVLPGVVEKRVRYFDGQFLQDQDFVDEQNYQLDREHRHNRLLHGPGIAEGLTITSTAPNQVTVAPGTAIDSDGYQLVLAQATTVDLPAGDFNDKQGIQLYISYLQSAENPQTAGGSGDFTRWLERPQLTALAPGNPYSGPAPPVLLANVALDNAGRVAVDNTVRSYSGLRLPGSAADAATLRATSSGLVDLAGSLTVDGSLGVGTTNPGNDLEVGAFGGQDRYLAFKVEGGNAHRSGVKMWAWQDNYGYSIQYDERLQTGNGLHVKTHNQNADGTTQLFVGWDGNVGLGTTSPGAKLEVAGGGGGSVDLVVNGRLRSNNNDGGLWVAQDRFVGGLDTSKIGFWNNNAWRLAVLNNGNVGIGTINPEHDLEVGAFEGQDRYLAFKVEGGNAHRSGVKMWAWQDNYGYSIQYDERLQTGNGLHVKTHNQNADGTTRLFVGWDGGVAIGTTNTNGHTLCVAGPTWLQGNLFVTGSLNYWWEPDGAWKNIQNRAGDWAGSYSTSAPSDIRLKTGLRPISRALDLVRKLQGVRYRWGDSGLRHFTRDIESSVFAGPDATDEQNQEVQQAERRKALEALAGDRMGLVAQDVETVVPELVHEDADGYKHIRYQHLTALLTEAIKEQDAVVQALSAEVAALRARSSSRTA